MGKQFESTGWLLLVLCIKVWGTCEDLRMMVLLKNECSLNGQDNYRWWGHSNPTSYQEKIFMIIITVSHFVKFSMTYLKIPGVLNYNTEITRLIRDHTLFYDDDLMIFFIWRGMSANCATSS